VHSYFEGKPSTRDITRSDSNINKEDIAQMYTQLFGEDGRRSALGNPTGRKEAELLSAWLQQMLAKYVGRPDEQPADMTPEEKRL